MNEELNTTEEKVYAKKISFQDSRGNAEIEFTVNVRNELIGDFVLVTYCPFIINPNKRPGVVKMTTKFMRQLLQIPAEVQGVPIDVLVKLAGGIKLDEGKSVLTELGKTDGPKT